MSQQRESFRELCVNPLARRHSACPTFSVVVPAYNKQDNLPESCRRLVPVMDGLGNSWELVLVNGGSSEQHQFMKGLFARIGFPSCAVTNDRRPCHAGQSAWNGWKLWNFAVEGITAFTTLPLRIATCLGLRVELAAAVFRLQLEPPGQNAAIEIAP